MKNIKYTVRNDLTQKQMDTLLDDSKTINLTNKVSSKQAYISRQARLDRNEGKKVIKGLIMPGLALIVLIIASVFGNSAEANNIPDEYKYYKVDNFQDYSRAIRKETCYRIGTQILGDITDEQVKHCTTVNTLITAIESDYMRSNRCVNDLNCKGLKGWQNGKYGFMKFNSLYEQNIYFAEKWFTYHYKKSLHTLVFGYKQKDGSYRYGWTYTQQQTYYNFLKSKYSTVYRNIK